VFNIWLFAASLQFTGMRKVNDRSPVEALSGSFGVLLIGSLVFLPAALQYLVESFSFVVGTALSCILALVFFVFGLVKFRSYNRSDEMLYSLGIAFFLCAHLAVAYFISPVLPSKGLSSLPILLLMLIATPIIRDAIFLGSEGLLDTGMKILGALLLVSCLFSILGLQPPTQSTGAKPCFPFTEPSFLAFCGVPVIIYVCVRSSVVGRVIWLALFLICTALLANLTMLAACLIAAVASLRLPMIFVMAGVSFLASRYVDITYYQERLDLSLSSNNLSTLVYVQGWQLIVESLRNTWGWGLGFQQLGLIYTNVPASYQIVLLLGRDSNLQDGGFVLAKGLSEIGVLVLPVVGYISYSAGRALLRLRAIAFGKVNAASAHVLASVSVLGYIIELYARGAGYFSGTTVLMLASFAYLRFERRQKKQTSLVLAEG